MNSSRGRYCRRGSAGRARPRKEEEYANSLGASAINDWNSRAMDHGRFMSKRYDRGKSFSGNRNQFCTGSTQSLRSPTNLNKGAHSTQGTRPFTNLSNNACLERNKPNKLDVNSILELQYDEIVLEIWQQPSCWKDLVNKDVKDDVMLNLIGVLACAVNTTSNKERLHHLLNDTLQTRFINKLCSFTLTVKKMTAGKAMIFFDNLALVLEVYSHAMVYSAVDKFPSLIDACIASQIALKLSPKLLQRYEHLQEMLSQVNFRLKKNNYRCPNVLNISKFTPPTDFSLMSVYPTMEDLDFYKVPFLRPNVTEGKYESCRHYLDVQFRLLREDFMRPLREDVTAYKEDPQSENLDIWVNKNVKILKFDIVKRELIHYIKLKLPKNFNAADSKRFMFGNLLCFSWDNFESMILATVVDYELNNLRNGILAVKFEANLELDYSKECIMIESRAFFLAYKHVLTALIKMCGEELPFSSYFVHIQSDVKPPDYLTNKDKYDLRVLIPVDKISIYMKHRLHGVRVMQDLELWPSKSDLGLDNSQRRVLKNALTRELVIIQGPPGTGKTFISLKIAEVLLHNMLYPPGPILVVCFTNHALDQFLEGVMSFTENIVRVGSRINNEKVKEFQINTLLKLKKEGPNYSLKYLYKKLKDLECKIHSLRLLINECIEPKGILKLDELTAYEIIPWHFKSQIINCPCGLVGWLTGDQDYTSICSNDVQENNIESSNLLIYELTELSLLNEINVLKKKLEAKPGDGVSVLKYRISVHRLTKLQEGLAVKNTTQRIVAIKDNVNLFTLDFTSRWQLYKSWLSTPMQNLKIQLSEVEAKYKSTSQELQEVFDQRYINIMKESSVVGMTTTAAAQHYSVMQAVAPPVGVVNKT